MKKIIALAVAAVVAAPAMADLTISGTAAVGYSSSDAAFATAGDATRLAECLSDNTTVASTDTAIAALTATGGTCAAAAAAKSGKGNGGFGVDTATLIVSGSETLENGLTISGKFGFGGGARGEAVGGQDAGLTVAGGFGSISVMAAEQGHGVFGYGSAVAENFQGELSGAATNADSISYTAPAMGMVTLSASYTEEVGLGKGQDDAFSPSLKASIDAGAASGFVQYTSYGDAGTTTDAENRIRIGAKYDAGMVVVSAAMGTTSYEGTKKDLDNTVIGLTLPLGATTLGLNYGQTDNGTTKRNGTSVGFKHALSENVAVTGKYTKYEASATTDVTKSSILMSLAF